MKNLILMVSLLSLGPNLFAEQVTVPQLTETKEQQKERVKWFRDAKFGLFIHWGPAAISGEEISWGMKDRIEGGDRHKKVPRETYMNLYKEFNPVKFDAGELLSLADNAGMKYVVLVTKHHDGFSLWPTEEKRFPEGAVYPEHYSIADTPYDKDILKEVADAARKHHLKLGWYYSTRDWTHPDYLKGDNKIYNDYYENQVEEIMKNYGQVDLMWFDHAFGSWDQYTIPRLYEKMYAINPKLLVNNRSARGIPDFPREFEPLVFADYDTPENRMGAFQHGRAWESCMILSPAPDHGGWSYRTGAVTRSLKECIQLLSSSVTGDGNMLLNLAPLPDGSLRPEEKAILEGIAPWTKANREAIYGTRGGPWINGDWGGSTYKGKHVYVHLFDASDEPIVFNRLPQKVTAATAMDGTPIPFSQDEKARTVSITVPAAYRDPNVTVVKLTLDETVKKVLFGPALANQAKSAVPGTLTFLPENASPEGELKRNKEGAGSVLIDWADPKNTVSWPLEIDSPGKYKVVLSTSCEGPGSMITADFGEHVKGIHGPVPVTGSFENYQSYTLNEVYFPNAESTTLTLRPAHHHAWKPVQLQSVKLIPSN